MCLIDKIAFFLFKINYKVRYKLKNIFIVIPKKINKIDDFINYKETPVRIPK